MSDFNPVIADDPHETLNRIIDVLQSQITLLSRFADVSDDDILKVGFTAADIKGHCLVLRSLQAAAEACYAQCYQAQRQEEEEEEEEEKEEAQTDEQM